ncbi:MAG: ATP-binding protein [Verrucomicrobiales bacterium]|nr:ATP-binding protein [Verrucomicrobiales bacterium]
MISIHCASLNYRGRAHPRHHLYVQGQPGDLFLAKLAALVVDLGDLDEQGHIATVEVAGRLKAALDVETVTKRFFSEFADEHGRFLDEISGVPDAHDRRWYASVILNRLMFIWFLQKKLFLGDRNGNHLPDLLVATRQTGRNRFFSHTLRDLFFEGFAKPASKRACVGKVPLGDIPYLNGGLFLPHGIEARIEGPDLFTGPYTRIRIPDAAFDAVFRLFAAYSWSLNDTPGGDDREINPDVLGYIFEKYINQKEFGAYYTRPEITEYLCEQTIHQLVLEAANRHAEAAAKLHQHGLKKSAPVRHFDTMSDLLLQADGAICRLLLQEDLPRLSLLDPACGSGAFLVAAMKTLLGLTTGLIGRCQAIGETRVLSWIEAERKKHKAPLAYWVKKKIITENLYGVDIMEEAVEIAKLRLFLALVASAETRDQLEPLPNIDFNLLAGNSLIGLLHVDPAKYNRQTGPGHSDGEQGRMKLRHQPGHDDLGMVIESTVAPSRKEVVGAFLAKQRTARYEELLREKNRLVTLYKDAGDWASSNQAGGEVKELTGLRDKIEAANRAAREILNKLLLDEFQGLGIQFHQATWDEKKRKEGRPQKRPLTITDLKELEPFHWGYEFDEIIVHRGGFDAIITNPPWEIFKPNSKEFFLRYSDLISRKKMRIEDFEKAKSTLLQDKDILAAWLEYLSGFPHLSRWFRDSPQFANQIGEVNGRKVGSDLNLYKMFLEQTVHLIRKGGRTGIVIPSGIYTDLGAMQLRKMLFEETQITALHSFSNERAIFEKDAVHHGFKFCFLTYRKGGTTSEFTASFRINPREAVGPDALESFLSSAPQHVAISVPLIRRLSPDSISVMEFREPIDVQVADKMLRYQLLGEVIKGSWNVRFTREFDMTNDSDLFHTETGKGRLPLYEGKMIWQFQHGYAEPRYWVDERVGRSRLLGSREDLGEELAYEKCRLGFRDVAASTNERTLISGIVPPHHFCGNTLPTLIEPIEVPDVLAVQCLFNSFAIDWVVRKKITNHCNFFYMQQLPIPRLTSRDADFRPLVERAARLVGTTPEFDDLLKEVFGGKATHRTHGITEPFHRQTVRAEIDALVARLYDLTDIEFQHILTTFPLVDESVKTQTLNTYRDLLRLGRL